MNRKLKIALYILLAAAAVAGVIWANVARLNSPVRELNVELEYPNGDTLVTADEIANLVQDQMPHLMTQLVKEVDESRVQAIAETSPYLCQCDVSVSVGRDIVIRAHQRRPIALVFDGKAQYYIDTTGIHMPVSTHSDPDIIIASGEIAGSATAFEYVRRMANFLYEHQEYSPLFDQIYIDKHRDIYLTPKLGKHVVLVGDTTDLDTKISNLMAFYQRGMKKTGWDTYSMIILKYHGQVIGRK